MGFWDTYGSGIIGGGLSLLGSIIGLPTAIKNSQTAESTQSANEAFQRWQMHNGEDVLNWNKEQYFDTMAYNKALNQLQMEREDTAIQRRMADLKAAGLNPLLAASGDGASSSAGSSLNAPELSAPGGSMISPSMRQPLDMGLQDAWNTAVQSMSEFKAMTKADTETGLISSQKTAQDIENGRNLDLWKHESQKRTQELILMQDTIDKTKQELENLKQQNENNKTTQQGQQIDNRIKLLDEEQKKIEVQIQEEVKKQTEFETLTKEHDTNIYLSGALPSSVVAQGAKTSVGQAAQDVAYGVHTARSNERNGQLYDNYSNNNQTPNKEVESVPVVNNLQRGDGYQDKGWLKQDGKKYYYHAGTGVAYSSTGDIYYGGRRIRPDEFEAAMNMIENSGRCLDSYLYPLGD